MSPHHLTTIGQAIAILQRDSPAETRLIGQLLDIINQPTKSSFRQTTKYKNPAGEGKKR